MKKVLFVCVHNSGRSQMAEAFLNELGKGRARGHSAGTSPANAVDPTVVVVMEEVGIDISKNVPQAFTVDMFDRADRVVTMGCGVEGVCPATSIETEDWGLDDPKGKSLEEVRRIRDEIRARVEKLVRELERS